MHMQKAKRENKRERERRKRREYFLEVVCISDNHRRERERTLICINALKCITLSMCVHECSVSHVIM
jgi:hypothetical protein